MWYDWKLQNSYIRTLRWDCFVDYSFKRQASIFTSTFKLKWTTKALKFEHCDVTESPWSATKWTSWCDCCCACEVQLILSKRHHFWSHSIFNTTIIIIRISKVSSIHTSFALRYTNLSWFMFLYLSFVVLRINFYCLDIVLLIHWIVLKNLTLSQEGEHLIGHVLLSNIKSFRYFQM